MIAQPRCYTCARPLAYARAPCPFCAAQPTRIFERIVSVGHFEPPLRDLIHAAKYHRAWEMAEYLTGVLRHQPDVRAFLSEIDLLIPIPLHPLRRLLRGYNQAHLIASRLARSFPHLRCRRLLRRIRYTPTQTRIHSLQGREENLKDAFRLRRLSLLAGKRIALVDDVTTSGATLRSAASQLRRGRPASISAIVLCVADPTRRAFQVV